MLGENTVILFQISTFIFPRSFDFVHQTEVSNNFPPAIHLILITVFEQAGDGSRQMADGSVVLLGCYR